MYTLSCMSGWFLSDIKSSNTGTASKKASHMLPSGTISLPCPCLMISTRLTLSGRATAFAGVRLGFYCYKKQSIWSFTTPEI
jgi:hypothetical protein